GPLRAHRTVVDRERELSRACSRLFPQEQVAGGSPMFKRMVALLAAAGALGIQAIPAAACGGLVAPNGAIRLSRATTLVAWHDGVERYLTSFSYEGSGVK